MNRQEFIDELNRLVDSGELATFKDIQDKIGGSRSKVDGEVKRGNYEKVKISGIYILIKK